MKPKKVPTRQCSGCGQKKAKSELVRVLKTPEDKIELDMTGKKSGRGAYICGDPECLKKARKSGRIEKSLSSKIPQEVYDELEGALKLGDK